MTRIQAYDHARDLSKKNDGDMYVVFESGEYHVTDEYGLDTSWLGATVDAWYFAGEMQQ